jgi:hypothetical protein
MTPPAPVRFGQVWESPDKAIGSMRYLVVSSDVYNDAFGDRRAITVEIDSRAVFDGVYREPITDAGTAYNDRGDLSRYRVGRWPLISVRRPTTSALALIACLWPPLPVRRTVAVYTPGLVGAVKATRTPIRDDELLTARGPEPLTRASTTSVFGAGP